MADRARRVTWVVLCAGFIAFSHMALSPLWYRLTNVDADGWPIGVPHPGCPACHRFGSVILEMTGATATIQCQQCGHRFQVRPPSPSR